MKKEAAHCCLGFYNVKCVLVMQARNRGATPSARGGCHSCVTAAPLQHPTNTAWLCKAMAKAAVLAGPSPNGLMVAFKMC